MLALLLATALLVGASFVLGQAIVFLCGWSEWRWWAPALGYGALLILFGQSTHVPHRQGLLVVAAAIAVVAALLLRFVRRSLREAGRDGWLLGIVLILLAAIPFFAAGYAGVLGPSVSNDMSQHLAGLWWLLDPSRPLPVAAIGGNLVTTGYPLGPHALAAGLVRGLGMTEESAFSAVTLAVPVLTGFIALGFVSDARRAARWALAAVIGLGYLPTAYLAQGSFKEIIMAMLALATTAVLADLQALPRLGWRSAMPVGVLAGAAIYTYSYGGLLWLIAICGLFLAAEVIRRRELFAVMRHWLAPGIGALLIAALVVLPEVHRVRAFRDSIFGQESLRNKGNLSHPLNPLESLGVWFNGDFRFNPDPRWPTVVFSSIALAALVASLPWWWRRRALAVPAAAAAAAIVWVNLTLTINIYNQAKGLVVLAPLVMTCIGVPLALAWRRDSRGGGRGRTLVRATGVVLFAAAAISSFAVLRSAPVGLGSHEREFAAIRPLVRDKPTLFVDNDHFAQWELRGARPLYTTNTLYAPGHLIMHEAKLGSWGTDVDYFDSRQLDRVSYIVTPGGRYRSELPPNFRLALRTPSYDLYHRTGATPSREPLEPAGEPAAILDCTSEDGKQYVERYKWAGVLPLPVVSDKWTGSIARPGGTARMKVALPRGRWDISLEYLSATPLTVRAPGLQKRLAQNFGLISSYWPAGTITSDGRPVTLTVSADKRTRFGRLLGSPKPMRAALSPGLRPLYRAAFTRHGETPRRLPVKQACGKYVDWYAPAGSKMR